MIVSEVSDFLSEKTYLLDVRSPSEYQEGHIPGAHSFPLFSDEERAKIGSIYKTHGQLNAVKKGLEFIGPKMLSFVESAETLSKSRFRIHCWRGGMRSESMAWLLERAGYECEVLEGGYKAFRRALFDFFDKSLIIKILSGFTGSKKTLILHEMARQGAQVIDLEGLARHQGSSFGKYNKSREQPTTEQFQNEIFERFRNFDLNKTVWLEDESFRIGSVFLIEGLYIQMKKSARVVVEVPKQKRVEYLVEDYGRLSTSKLIAATNGIRKKLGYDNADLAAKFIEEGRLTEAADIILTYYDRSYLKSIDEKKELIDARLTFDGESIQEIAEELLKREKHGI